MQTDTIPVSGDVVFKIVWIMAVLAFFIERALAVLFEHRLWLKLEDKFHLKGLKEIIAIAFAYNLCVWSGFDGLSLMFQKVSSRYSLILSALVIAGGSKGAVKLMQGYLGIKKTSVIRGGKQ